MVVALAIELTCAGELMPGLEMFGYGLVEQRALRVARVVEFGFGTRLSARAHEGASLLGLAVRWPWGSASVGWVPDDTVFISSFIRH